ncbi:MAG: DNA polymerase [Methanobrevibacter sp.]|jgi:hypothetical protein|nr:DNA polymerase [Candidatus Methanovirga australis]
MSNALVKSIFDLLLAHQDISITSTDNTYDAFVEGCIKYVDERPFEKNIQAMLWIQKNDNVKQFYPIEDIKNYGINVVIQRAYNLISGNGSDEPDNFEVNHRNEIQTPRPKAIGVHFFMKFVKMNKREYNFKTGAFFPMINTSDLNLDCWQIHNELKPKDEFCFIWSLMMSKLFTDGQIDTIKRLIETRSFPKRKITDICNKFNVEIVIIDGMIQQKVNQWKNKKNDGNGCGKVVMYLILNHYFLYRSYDHTGKILIDLSPKIIKNGVHYYFDPLKFLRLLIRKNYLKQLEPTDLGFLQSVENSKKLPDYDGLEYDEENCLKKCKFEKSCVEYEHVICSDFETDTHGEKHVPFIVCSAWMTNGRINYITHYGEDCAKQFLDWLPNNSLIWFHNLKYDSSFFLNCGMKLKNVKFIQRGSTILQINLTYKGKSKEKSKNLCFKDSYSIIPHPLRSFRDIFGLEVAKDCCPYNCLTKEYRQMKWIPLQACLNDLQTNDHKLFVSNCIQIKCITNKGKYNANDECYANKGKCTMNAIQTPCKQSMNAIQTNSKHIANDECYTNMNECMTNDECFTIKQQIQSQSQTIDHVFANVNAYVINIIDYVQYYCLRDVEVLLKGLIKFDSDLKIIFDTNNVNFEGINQYVSISAIGYALAEKYGCFEDCYELAGKPQDFIMRCVSGGRCMLCNNQKNIITGKIQDFDAVSLYPSAMAVMEGVPKGIPKIITEFNPMKYSNYFIEIKIQNIDDIYGFPLVFKKLKNKKVFINETTDHFYVDKRSLLDLIEFYPNFKYEFIRGYYFNDGFNTSINSFIRELFELRKTYKQQKNPLESTIKLLLNSIYGKSILKPIPTKIISKPKKELDHYIILHQNEIVEINTNDKLKMAYIKLKESINDHYNLPQFGVCVLSQSKHLMNRVMCLAENNKIPIFYQDTDSMHILDQDIPRLSELFKDKYKFDLIGNNLCQYHSDFSPVNGKGSWSKKFIGLGKKAYLDVLTNEDDDIDYHIRLKGIPNQVIWNYCKNNEVGIEELYMKLYNGETIIFDLTDGSQAFKKGKTYEYNTLSTFNRKVKF